MGSAKTGRKAERYSGTVLEEKLRVYDMKEKYKNKTLLVLGSNVGAKDIVLYAKENGAYTIVADYLPPEKSEAKNVADDHFLVSTGDLDGLSKLVEEKQVDGILAGVSEFNLLNAMELSEKHGLPFYCNRKQWDQIEKKDEFRRFCQENGVPCPETYYAGRYEGAIPWDSVVYPAVLKPVDANASQGVFICNSEEELRLHIEEAGACSQCGDIIIEEFTEGYEFSAHYTIVNGNASLSCMDNRYPAAIHEGNVTTIPIARIYPGLFLEEYISQVNPAMLKLCRALGMQTGVLFVQGIYHPAKNRFSIFEAGLRCAGEAPYRIISQVNKVNFLHTVVDYALGVTPDFCLERDDPYMKGKCCGVVSFASTGGKVGEIRGLEETVKKVSSVIAYESRYPVGSDTPCGDTLRQIMLRFVMVCSSREEMERDISFINENVQVFDDRGQNMVLKMDAGRIWGIK